MTHHQLGPPLTLTERLEELNNNLQSLGDRLRDSIAGAIGTAVAEAVRDAVHGLLGGPEAAPHSQDNRWQDDRRQDRRWDQDNDPWSAQEWRDPDDPWQERPFDPPQFQHRGSYPAQTGKRLGKALTAALQTTLWWLQEQKSRRPLVATSAVALAAGVAAFCYGPALAAGVGVLASVASLLLTSRGAVLTAERLAEATSG